MNKAEAVTLITHAAIHHIAQAEHLLGVIYEYGYGVKQDLQRAMYYYEIASEKKYIEATYNLALMHASARGTPQNFNLAMSLFEVGVQSGHPGSTYYMVSPPNTYDTTCSKSCMYAICVCRVYSIFMATVVLVTMIKHCNSLSALFPPL